MFSNEFPMKKLYTSASGHNNLISSIRSTTKFMESTCACADGTSYGSSTTIYGPSYGCYNRTSMLLVVRSEWKLPKTIRDETTYVAINTSWGILQAASASPSWRWVLTSRERASDVEKPRHVNAHSNKKSESSEVDTNSSTISYFFACANNAPWNVLFRLALLRAFRRPHLNVTKLGLWIKEASEAQNRTVRGPTTWNTLLSSDQKIFEDIVSFLHWNVRFRSALRGASRRPRFDVTKLGLRSNTERASDVEKPRNVKANNDRKRLRKSTQNSLSQSSFGTPRGIEGEEEVVEASGESVCFTRKRIR